MLYRAPNKVPVKASSHPRCHWTKKKGNWKVKKAFASIEEAESYIKKHKMKNYTAYICKVCGCVHIGFYND